MLAISTDRLRGETFSATEASAFSDVTLKKVRGELEKGIIPASSPPRLGFSALVYLHLIHLTEEALGSLGIPVRRHIHQLVAAALAESRFDTIRIAESLTLHLKPSLTRISEVITKFRAWKETLVTDPNILGGETVFPRSRLSVEHIGGILERGESPEHILDDYPYLTPQDLDFARIYVRAYPRVGRPPKHQATP